MICLLPSKHSKGAGISKEQESSGKENVEERKGKDGLMLDEQKIGGIKCLEEKLQKTRGEKIFGFPGRNLCFSCRNYSHT